MMAEVTEVSTVGTQSNLLLTYLATLPTAEPLTRTAKPGKSQHTANLLLVYREDPRLGVKDKSLVFQESQLA